MKTKTVLRKRSNLRRDHAKIQTAWHGEGTYILISIPHNDANGYVLNLIIIFK